MAESRRPRNLIPLLTLAGALAIAAVVAIVLLMNRMPAPTAAPAPGSPTPEASTPSVAPSPTPTEAEEPTANEVALGEEGFTIVADDGSELFAYGWRDDAAGAVSALTDAFGSEPSESVYEGDGTHFPDYTSYTWDGFTYFDMIPTEGGKSRDEYSIPSYVTMTGQAVDGVTVTPEFDLAIGLTADEVRALGPDKELAMPDGEPRFFFAIDRADGAGENGELDGYSPWVDTDPADETVVSISYRPYYDF
ncbi:hypothetical protein [Microbacterium sp. 77mftsu3.1]|uniref:hypothetical protein n=1 Tax=Microbacterium sp. 77mftsu3.1 TaxID=1761802 RepID=UPI0003A05B3C|nr:hypothetical protein [Microbacterium sp. 77mftsu3.1]SDG55345.1 hypothetical protein SAMN04488590_1078 [Microbacterium sp. 77mftsu3.1]